MIKSINFTNEELSKLKEWIYSEDCYESTTHPYVLDGEKKVIKLFKPHVDLENKIKKINLIKNRTKNLNFVVTADFFVENNNKIIGYGMPYIKGTKMDYVKGSNLKKNIFYLKQISEELKKLHDLNIIVADFDHNYIIKPNDEINLIDHDNFAIDDFEIDSKNNFVTKYIKKTGKLDKKFDDYFLNLFTISIFTGRNILSVFHSNSYTFNKWPKDDEICEIMTKTLDLDYPYNEDLIIDKIKSKNDLKKLRKRLF